MQFVYFFSGFIETFPGNDIVDEIMIPDSRSPLVQRIAKLDPYIVDREGNQFLIGCFVRFFIIFVHFHLQLFYNRHYKRDAAKVQHFYIFSTHFWLYI